MSALKNQLFIHGLRGQLKEARGVLDNWLLHDPPESARVELAEELLTTLAHYLHKARRGAEEPFLHEAADLVDAVAKRPR